ncbi:hypothetical protein HZY97_16170 [Sphingomonas sp. R-74633]|uniref:hypothetical protein n=1 Tax=Sphingomonas sp. R-74633 TaxID=2751188 RepID=UPI0015D1E5BC|nr:hypothetical protein [Sphingomonas sp. R-74633]NYT42309.1 hypothetical protein [Sphingomonas sp. R-74633]
MADGGTGLASAVGQAIERRGEMMFADPEQVELALEAAGGLRDLPAVKAAVVEVRKAGRPKNSPNKRTGKIRDFLLSQHRHPLHTLAMMQDQSPDVLAAQLDCSKLEAARVIVAAAGELAPYCESRMPIGIANAGEGHMMMVLGAGAPIVAALQGGASIDRATGALTFGPPPEVADFTEVSDDEAGASE